MGVFTMFGTRKENFDILGLSRSPRKNFLSPLKVNINIVDFYMNFYEKVPSTLDHAGFFSKYSTAPRPLQHKGYFLLIFIS